MKQGEYKMTANVTTPRTIGWDEIPEPQEAKKSFSNKKGATSNNQDVFAKFPPGTHQIRLVGKPLPIDLAFFPNPQNPGGKDPSKSKTIKYLIPKEYLDRVKSLGVEVKEYYAICIFDRTDTRAGITRVKILEKGLSVIKPFKQYAKHRKDADGKSVNPGSNSGPDWLVEVTKTGPNAYNIEYAIQPLDPTPWSETEREFLNRDTRDKKYENLPLGERGKIILEDFYDLTKAKERLEKFLSTNNGLSTAEVEDVADYSGKNDSKKINSLDDLPPVDEDVAEIAARQLKDEVF
jgi:hypothetical protein